MKEYLFYWNSTFPFDRLWREKYKIPFNSKKHLNANQVDILYDLLEDKLFKQFFDDRVKEKKRLDEYEKTGVLLQISDEEQLKRFDSFLAEDPKRLRLIEKTTGNG